MAGGTTVDERKGLQVTHALRFKAGNATRELPGWAAWFIDLGAWTARQASDSSRTVVVATVPVAGYAAVFAALGAAAANFRDRSPDDEIAHFEFLSSLPNGTRVEYRKAVGSNKLTQGSIIGPTERQVQGRSEPYIQLAGGTLRPWWNCADITPVDEDATVFVHDRLLSKAPEFVRACVGVDPATHALYSSLDCLIVGTKRSLEDEMSVNFVCDGASGTLQDALRCRTMLHPADRYRTDLRSASASVSDADRLIRPPLVVLDGPVAALNWRNSYPSVPSLTIIDRSAPSAEAARDAFLTDRASSLRDIEVDSELPACPGGVELLIFEEALR